MDRLEKIFSDKSLTLEITCGELVDGRSALSCIKQQIKDLIMSERKEADVLARIDELDNNLPTIVGYDLLYLYKSLRERIVARINEIELQGKQNE